MPNFENFSQLGEWIKSETSHFTDGLDGGLNVHTRRMTAYLLWWFFVYQMSSALLQFKDATNNRLLAIVVPILLSLFGTSLKNTKIVPAWVAEAIDGTLFFRFTGRLLIYTILGLSGANVLASVVCPAVINPILEAGKRKYAGSNAVSEQ